MLGSTCTPCCAPLYVCGNTSQPYEGQTGIFDSSGRWCLSGVRPAEITIRYTAEASVTTFYGYQNLSGPWFSGYFFDDQRGYYRKRYKRTLTLDLDSLNVDYVLTPTFFFAPNQQTTVCGYSFGQFQCPRIFAGYEPNGLTLNGVTYNAYAESEAFPSYTLTFQSCNSTVPGTVPTTGTLTREYEYRPYDYIGNFQLQPTGPWTRDATLDTESGSIPCRYLWALTGRSILTEPACDLRGLNLSWEGNIVVSSSVEYFSSSVEDVAGSDPIDGQPMLPGFSLEVTIISE